MPTPIAHRPKSRPTASCLPCRTRKVKCNRLQPCETCSARNIAHECKYAVPDEDRQAIAQAEMIAELRAEVNRLQRQYHEYQESSSVDEFYVNILEEGSGALEELENGEESLGEGDDDDDELERVYRILKDGEWERVREVVGRIRGGTTISV
ncbi:Zn(II)2Cys6 transcription factor domain-containing protein [Aspergillus tubingensis]|uniref:Zn(II)2Cys6 transcription factor domain-containing protein n=1 Tax=Aspergillus tubingensis TaxID=5068 RepID=UPI0015785281|nr:C6 finger domain protein [Aspergillus tubingensis]GFN12399.1 C6 finger domain protein [Aspergillus tubingensis]